MSSKVAHIADCILSQLKSSEKEMLGFLEQLVSLESPSRNPKSQYKIIKFIAEELKKLGFYTLHVPGKETGGYLYARPIERDKSKALQLMIGHCDTVWELDTIKQMPVTNDGRIMRGPGVYDMKAGLTQIIFALKIIDALNLTLPMTPVLLINSDEEIGSRESRRAIERLAKLSERAYIMEPPLGLTGKLKTARKGIGRFTITVKGKAAHAGLDPQKGVNAIVELSHQVQRLYAMNDFDRGITVNVGMIEGGVSPNVIAPQSKAVVDVRVLNKKDGKRITEEILSLKPTMPDVEVQIEGGIGRPPMEQTTANRMLWRLAKAQGALLGLDLEEATAGGGSDGNTTSLYTATLDGLGTTGDGAHAQHEYILLDEFPVRTALLTLLMLAGAGNN
ncbi:M20 family metallopeptidase [Muricauda sp. 334s03]|uniref:M20 family metallopeptidase n=1 Tax=Flagellimonas yonaguniensis TaxID=3031325 RepID=A0ABT5XW39_9FLAO|nr:M20 family metallopeptidase [[Muricauda] yonaguniensis]MDF0715410.1 M20 family metallopeptidase [[Muricauda] yonaguniensis]